MATSFSSRKVARAARMGGTRRRRPNAAIGWYASLLVIVLIGSGFVAFSRAEHRDESSPGSTAPFAPSQDRQGDRWFESVGFFICDKFADNVTPTDDPYGITTNGDGVILIAPNQKKYAGRNATVGLFAKGAGIELDADSFKLPNNETTYGDGTKCGDRDGKLIVREWEDATKAEEGEMVLGNPASLLLANRAAVTIGWVPDDYDENTLPIPPSAATLEQRINDDLASQQAAESAPAATMPVESAPPAGETPAPSAPAAPQ